MLCKIVENVSTIVLNCSFKHMCSFFFFNIFMVMGDYGSVGRWVVQRPKAKRLKSRSLLVRCCVLGQDTKPEIAPNGVNETPL